MATSVYGQVPLAPPDPILGLSVAYREDPSPNKVNLGIGAYRNDEGEPYVLPVVKKVEKKIIEDPKMNKEYQPQQGMEDYRREVAKLLFGKDSKVLAEGKVVTVQALSGTGALRVGAEFIRKFLPKNTRVYCPVPTWGNHFQILQHANLESGTYRYFDNKTMGLDFDGLIEDFNKIPEGSFVIMHVCAHNPTGVDPSQEQWKKIAEVCQKRRLTPFFDNAYQGFASGDLEKDSFAVRLFADMGMEFLCAQSFAKNFGLYGERVGALHIVTNSEENAKSILTQLQVIIRSMYSNPPLHGARIVKTILADEELRKEWENELVIMSSRIKKMRQALFDELVKMKTPSPSVTGNWNHIVDQIGMFAFTGLNQKQVEILKSKYHIYMTSNGRISIAGLNSKNVAYVAKAFHEVITGQ